MPKANRRCAHCGKEYYVCYSCVNINSYKRLYCSPQCYRASLEKTEEKEEKKKVKKEKPKKDYFFQPSEEIFVEQ